MSLRLSANKNLTLHSDESFRGVHVYTDKGPLIQNYLDQVYHLVESVVGQYISTYAFRFDLHFPKLSDAWHNDIISTFLDSFKAQLKAYFKRNGIDYRSCCPKFIWAKERNQSMNPHYHVVVFFNGEVFNCKERSNEPGWSLKRCIERAWLNQLNRGGDDFDITGLVGFPKNDYYLERHSTNFLQTLTNLFYRVSYLTKARTKAYVDGSRHFSTSQPFPLPEDIRLEDLMAFHRYEHAHIDHRSYLYADYSWQYRYGKRYGRF